MTRRAVALPAAELQVLDGIARGLSNLEVGEEMHLAEATVKDYLRRAAGRLGVPNRRAHVVATAYRLGLLPAAVDQIPELVDALVTRYERTTGRRFEPIR